MANEIQISAGVTQTNNGTTVTLSKVVTLSLNTGVTGKYSNVQTIGTTAEPLTVPGDFDISYIGVCNLDSTNYIDWGYTNPPTAENRLYPGDVAIFRPLDQSAPVIYFKANSAACALSVVIAGDDA